MNRKEYMERLQMDLEAVDEQTAKEILQDFTDHFEQGLSEGRSEEEISEELGDPAELISELNTRPHRQAQAESQTQIDALSMVSIEAESADITLKQGTGNDVLVDFYDSRNPLRVHNYRLETVQENDVYAIRVIRLQNSWLRAGAGEHLRLDVTLPSASLDVKISSMSGDIRVPEILHCGKGGAAVIELHFQMLDIQQHHVSPSLSRMPSPTMPTPRIIRTITRAGNRMSQGAVVK